MRLLNRLSVSLLSSAAVAMIATPALAQKVPVGRTPTPAPTPAPAPIPVTPETLPSTTLAQALQQSTDHTTLIKLLQAANLGGVLTEPGPVTIFAPNDAAFGRLAPGTVDALLQPQNSSSLNQILKYHIVPGVHTTEELLKALKASGGTLTLNTLDGQPLTVSAAGTSAIMLTDSLGNKAYVTKASDQEANGVLEYINGVLSPKMVAQPPAAPAAGADATAGATATQPAAATSDTGATAGGETAPDQDSSGG